MAIDFSPERWSEVKEAHERWWAGELERPLVQMRVKSKDPGRPAPRLPHRNFVPFYDLSVSPEEIVDIWDYELSCFEYLGDGFPTIWPNFGAGVIAALLGAELRNGEDTVWFHPREQQEIADIRFVYDPESVWLRRIKAVCQAAVDRWQGSVQVGMTDLGGNLDILASFRPSERLLLDLYDDPDEVKRLTWEAHEFWFKYFAELDAILRPVNPGYTAWTPILSSEPYYMLQCDFCYMIGPDMFDEFVKPELAATCARIANPFYHLDGPGQLAHLPSLLQIEELKGVQWIPGSGNPPQQEWPEVYRQIKAAGKLIQLWDDAGLTVLDAVAGQVGEARGIVVLASGEGAKRDAALQALRRYGVA